jgi:hypothetical protein
VEAGKLFNLTTMLAASAFVTSLLLRLTPLPVFGAAALGLLTALNPVFIYQSTTFYVDNILANAIVVLVAGLTLYVVTRRWQALAVGLLAAGLAINVKQTGFVYVAVLLALAVPVVLWRHGAREAWRMAAAAAATGVVGGMILGYVPYVRNLLEYGDPFYPATPAQGLLSTATQVPANLSESDRVTRFLVSNFSRSELVRPPRSTRLKFPLSIERGELRGLYGADIESGGFGPLYGAALLLACVGGISLWVGRSTRPAGGIVLIAAGCLLVTMFVHRETWWARYVPQAWLLPMLVMIPSLCTPRRSFQWWLGGGLAVLATINLLIIGANVGWRQINYARDMRESLQNMAAAAPVDVYLGSFRSLRQRLREAGLDFQMVEAPLDSERRHAIPAPGNQAFWLQSSRRSAR